MFKVLFAQDSRAKDLFCGVPFGAELSLFFSKYLLAVDFEEDSSNDAVFTVF